MIDFLKEHIIYLISLFSILGFLKFLVSSYLEIRRMKVMNKDLFDITKTDVGFTNIKIQTCDLKVKDLVESLNQKIEQDINNKKAS